MNPPSPLTSLASHCRGAISLVGGRRSTSQRGRSPGRRGVSEVIGFVLLFGVLILGLTIVQLYAVPTTNERLEFEHNQRALTDVAEVSDLISQVAATGKPGSVTIEAGMQYPSRLFLFNPPPVSSSIRTTNSGAVTIENAHGIGEVDDYWNGTALSFDTASIAYQPNYHLYDHAPTRVVEHGLVYDRFSNGEMLPRNRAPLIEDNSITIVTISGNLDTSTAGSYVLEAAPVSVPGAPITISDQGTPITITLPTGLSESEMETALAHELGADGRVTNVADNGDGTVTITLRSGSYELTMAQLQVGTEASPTVRGHYVVPVTESPVSVPEGVNRTVMVEVRDVFNNPVSGVTVEAVTDRVDSSVSPETSTTDQNGHARIQYIAPPNVHGVAQVDTINVTIDDRSRLTSGFDPESLEDLSIDVQIENQDRSGIQTDLNPGVGLGGVSYWNVTDTDEQFSVANGKWLGIDRIDEIILSDGEDILHQYCPGASGNPHADCRFVNELRVTFTIWDQNAAYGVDVKLLDTNRDGDFVDIQQGSEREWTELPHVTITDAQTETVIFRRPLTDTAIQDLTNGGLDILTYAGNYDAAVQHVGQGNDRLDMIGDQDELDELDQLQDADWFTGRMIGRVFISIPA